MTDSKSVPEWFRFAEMDLSSAKYLFEMMYPKPLELICYHCQQAAEKFIKGVMINLGYEIVKTHDLVMLRNNLAEKVETDSIAFECVTLTPYATATRYPSAIEVDESQTAAAIAQAQKVKEWAENLIKF